MIKKEHINQKNIWILVLTIIVIILVWGIIGGNVAQSVGITCNAGIGDVLCWFWETNAIGDLGDTIDEIFN
ncbi:MAG: hypothetical protein ACLFPL_01130 [Candidatus Nanoarchaeia archaeon]